MADVRCLDGVLGTSVVLVRFVVARFGGAVSVSETSISSSSSSDASSCLTRRVTHSGRGRVTIFP